jgi:malonyl-CoA decarboxylase
MSRTAFFQQLFESIADRGREVVGRVPAKPDGTGELAALGRALLSQRGEASAAALAQDLIAAYRKLDRPGRRRFFTFLGDELSPDPERVTEAAEAYRRDPSPEHLAALTRVAEPPRQELFRRMNMASGGTQTLVDLRVALIDELKDAPELRAVDQDLLHLFSSWFNRGFLTLERIDWRTAALILEKLIAYEAVHAIQGWDDLRRRLARDRRCFAFFHPALPDEPLIFVEVALTRGMAGSVQPLIDPDDQPGDPEQADSAIFYSISNCQTGLRGVSFGSFLIKQVAAELEEELPNLKTFATLSPVPGFRKWLEDVRMPVPKTGGSRPPGSELARITARLGDGAWQEDTAQLKELQAPLCSLCAHYLLNVKRDDGLPRDPVARFHLGNGARLERLNWQGDTSAKGIAQSAGIMVNYLYRLDQLERNHEAFVNRKQVKAGRSVVQLAHGAPLPEPLEHVT